MCRMRHTFKKMAGSMCKGALQMLKTHDKIVCKSQL
jgi:hypothetical protein